MFLFQLSDKAALLFRQYVKDSLYDRISTRPFLNNIEKKWLAFQLLCALNQCHKLNVNINALWKISSQLYCMSHCKHSNVPSLKKQTSIGFTFSLCTCQSESGGGGGSTPGHPDCLELLDPQAQNKLKQSRLKAKFFKVYYK